MMKSGNLVIRYVPCPSSSPDTTIAGLSIEFDPRKEKAAKEKKKNPDEVRSWAYLGLPFGFEDLICTCNGNTEYIA